MYLFNYINGKCHLIKAEWEREREIKHNKNIFIERDYNEHKINSVANDDVTSLLGFHLVIEIKVSNTICS